MYNVRGQYNVNMHYRVSRSNLWILVDFTFGRKFMHYSTYSINVGRPLVGLHYFLVTAIGDIMHVRCFQIWMP